MFIVVLLVSFFTQIKASELQVISVEDFLQTTSARLSGKQFRYTAHAHRDNLVPVHFPSFAEGSAPSDFSCIANPSTLVSTFMVSDPENLLSPGSIAPGRQKVSADGRIVVERAATATHVVANYNNDIFLKRWPEVPGNDIGARTIFRTIFPRISDADVPLPACEVILINRVVYSVSRFMDGALFGEVLREVEAKPTIAPSYAFNLRELQRLFLFCFLAVPEDCHKNNCLVRRVSGSSSKFLLIDFERSFGRMIAGGTRVHCVLFCFHEALARPIDESVYQEIMASKRGILEAGLRLLLENSYQATLAEIAGGHERVRSAGTILGVPIDLVSIQGMSTRFNDFIRHVSSNKGQSLANIFGTVAPDLDGIYGFRAYVAPSTPEPELIAVSRRVRAIEGTRGSGVTPASANVALEKYLGSTDHNRRVLLQTLDWALANCGTLDAIERVGIQLMIGNVRALISQVDSHTMRPSSALASAVGKVPAASAGLGRGTAAAAVAGGPRGTSAACGKGGQVVEVAKKK